MRRPARAPAGPDCASTAELQDFRAIATDSGYWSLGTSGGKHEALVLVVAIAVWCAHGGAVPRQVLLDWYPRRTTAVRGEAVAPPTRCAGRRQLLARHREAALAVGVSRPRPSTAVCARWAATAPSRSRRTRRGYWSARVAAGEGCNLVPIHTQPSRLWPIDYRDMSTNVNHSDILSQYPSRL